MDGWISVWGLNLGSFKAAKEKIPWERKYINAKVVGGFKTTHLKNIMIVKLDHFPKDRGEKVSNHHLAPTKSWAS